MGKNGYLMRKEQEQNALIRAVKETYVQFMTDTLIDTINDPEIMGKDVFGVQRIETLIKGWQKKYRFWHPVLERGKEQDYWQKKFDEKMLSIVGEKLFTDFPNRYEYVRELDKL